MIFFSWKSDKKLKVLRESKCIQFLTRRLSSLSYMRCKHGSRSLSTQPKTELKTLWKVLLLLLFLHTLTARHTLGTQRTTIVSLLLLTLYLNLRYLAQDLGHNRCSINAYPTNEWMPGGPNRSTDSDTHNFSFDSTTKYADAGPRKRGLSLEKVGPVTLKDSSTPAKIIAVDAACQAGIGVTFSNKSPQALECTPCQGLSWLGRRLDTASRFVWDADWRSPLKTHLYMQNTPIQL